MVDIGIAAIVLFLLLRFFNSRRGLAYIGLMLGSLVVLIISAQINLPALHLIAQAAIVVLLIGLPLFFEEKWLSMFAKKDVSYQAEPNFMHPIVIGLISIIAAFLLAALNNSPTVKTAELPQGVAVSAANLKEGLSANFGSQKRISVIVRAPRQTWEKLKSEDFAASINAEQLAEGTYDVTVAVTSTNPEAKIIRVKPSHVTVTIEPVIRKTVPIVARYTGKAANELVPGDPIIDPEKAEVTGPKSIVDDISQATLQINIDNQSAPISQKYQLVALSSSGSRIEDVTFGPAEAVVKLSFVKAGKVKNVPIKVKVDGQPSSGFWVESVSTDPAIIPVTGEIDTLEKMTFIETETVSLSGLNDDKQQSVNLKFPSGITSSDGTSKVTVSLKVSPASTTKSITPTYVYLGLDPSLKVTSITPTSINAIVSGDSSLLSGLSSNDVKLNINLSAYKSAGAYAITIKNDSFELKTGVSLVSFLPSAINVTLDNK